MSTNPKKPTAPPRPVLPHERAYSRTAPKVLQPKLGPVAPPVYKPTVPKVLQQKHATSSSPITTKPPRIPTAPPVYRPQKPVSIQPKSKGQFGRPPSAPPVFRPVTKGNIPHNLLRAGSTRPSSARAWRPTAERVVLQTKPSAIGQPFRGLPAAVNVQRVPDFNRNARQVIQRHWDYSQFLSHEQSGLLGPAIDVFTSGVKHTYGSGVAMYRLADSNPNFDVEFVPEDRAEGVGGTTGLVFKRSGEPVVGHDRLGNVMVMDADVIRKARNEGLKLLIKINLGSRLSATIGSIIATLVHEYGVHAAEYYTYIRGILNGSLDEAATAARGLAAAQGVGRPPAVKFMHRIINALGLPTGSSTDIETIMGQREHQSLGRGGSRYYQALVERIRDQELNTFYHKRWTSNRQHFIDAQEADVSQHRLSHGPPSELISIALNIGTPLSELERRSKELTEGLGSLGRSRSMASSSYAPTTPSPASSTPPAAAAATPTSPGSTAGPSHPFSISAFS